jgi:acetyl esterase/lipase
VSNSILRPPLDAEIARALEERRDIVVTSMAVDDIPRVRSLAQPIPVSEITHHGAFERHELVATGVGRTDVPVVVYVPPQVRAPVPVLLFFHGGGLVAGNADPDMPVVAALAHEAGCAVVSVDYRLAPESPYPAALDDAVTALAWLANGDVPAQIDQSAIVLMGISAGGGLAATAALHARDNEGPTVTGLLLASPMLDHRSASFSARQMAGVGAWDASANATAWHAYLGVAAKPTYASAAAFEDLSGLAPTYIDVGSAETFRDECVHFADKIWRSGGDAELHVWPGGVHGFEFLAPWALLSIAARSQRSSWLRRLLTRA